jgi:hypothetical protein
MYTPSSTTTPSRPRWRRTRRGAAGAALALCAGVGTFATIGNAASSQAGSYVPVTPCRLLDTRAGAGNVGARSTPLGPNETHTVAVRGTNGNCTIPAAAIGAVLNVTVVNASAASFLTVFPSDVARPLTANLNWIAGQPPTPNGVTATLADDGKLSFYNLSGTVDVVVDVMGFYEPGASIPASVTYSEAEVDALVLANRPRAQFVGGNQSRTVGTSPVVVREILVTAPVAGLITATSNASVFEESVGDLVHCSISLTDQLDSSYMQTWESGGNLSGGRAVLAGVRAIPVNANQNVIVSLVCSHIGNSADASIVDSNLSTLFTAGNQQS